MIVVCLQARPGCLKVMYSLRWTSCGLCYFKTFNKLLLEWLLKRTFFNAGHFAKQLVIYSQDGVRDFL